MFRLALGFDVSGGNPLPRPLLVKVLAVGCPLIIASFLGPLSLEFLELSTKGCLRLEITIWLATTLSRDTLQTNLAMSFTVTEVPTENYELAVLALSATSTTPTQSPERPTLSKLRTTVAIVAVVCSTLLASIVNGIFTIELPTIAASVDLDPRLLLWPQSIVALVSACTLLLCGSVSDVVGNKRTYLVGSFLQSAFVLATSLSRTGTQVLVFRAFMGLAQSMCLPSSTSIITNTFPIGRARNIAFACMGAGQPLGFSIGLVFGGVFTNVLSWRFGLYLVAGTNFTIVLMAALGLEEYRKSSIKSITSQLREDIDWFGVFLVSTSLAMLCYVLA